jgi:hypothetical protein
MVKSNCTISFFRNDLSSTGLSVGKCPVKNCSSQIYEIRFNKKSMVPFCQEHGLTIHSGSFVYYNGDSEEDRTIATKRNLMFHADYYISNFFGKSNKMESGRLCYEGSEDAVSYNVFTELLTNKTALKQVVKSITGKCPKDEVGLYLWGSKIDLGNTSAYTYEPLKKVRENLEKDIKRFKTEPDIMLIVPKTVVICIEAKFGSKNPLARDKDVAEGEKPKKIEDLIERYCNKNEFINRNEIFDFESERPRLLYEQLFRNIVFAASMAKLEGASEWYVANLRSQHNINVKRGKPESMPVVRSVRSILKPEQKKRFVHLTWEDIYDNCVKGNSDLCNLAWYMKNKTLNCRRAFNIV